MEDDHPDYRYQNLLTYIQLRYATMTLLSGFQRRDFAFFKYVKPRVPAAVVQLKMNLLPTY
jgi:hypothetical protein